MAQNDAILRQLRAIVDAGGPQTPVVSTPRPTGTIKALSPLDKFRERVLPSSDEPLAQKGLGNVFLGRGEATSNAPSLEDVGGMAPPMAITALPIKRCAKRLHRSFLNR